MKIAIAGTGYVGISSAIPPAQHNQVVALDIVPETIEMLNSITDDARDVACKAYSQYVFGKIA